MTKKPKVGQPYRWQGKRLLKVPEVGVRENACVGCLCEEERRNDDDEYEYLDLCEVKGKHDCRQFDDNGNVIGGHIFIKDTHEAIVEYIARRLE